MHRCIGQEHPAKNQSGNNTNFKLIMTNVRTSLQPLHCLRALIGNNVKSHLRYQLTQIHISDRNESPLV